MSNSVSTGSVTDTGVAATTTGSHRFTIEVNAAGTSVSFYINGSLVATNTTNIPTGSSRTFGINVGVRGTAGTNTARGIQISYMLYRNDLTTPR
jgi:hypothetical protein